MRNVFIFLTSAFVFCGCGISKHKNIVYSKENKLSLSVFSPKHKTEPKEVLLFMHGGSWAHGKRKTYNFFGKRLARKGIVGIVVDYRLSPATDGEGMAMDVAQAVKWTKEHIAEYGGNPDKIFVSGHSAGAQLAAQVAMNDRYFDSLKIKNPVAGTILIDAFGLDMYTFLKESNYNRDIYLSVFSTDSLNWKRGSPIYNLKKEMPPFIQFLGGKTNSNIIQSNTAFHKELLKYQPNAQLITVEGKAHIGMIFSFYNSGKKEYDTIIDFMKAQKKEPR